MPPNTCRQSTSPDGVEDLGGGSRIPGGNETLRKVLKYQLRERFTKA